MPWPTVRRRVRKAQPRSVRCEAAQPRLIVSRVVAAARNQQELCVALVSTSGKPWCWMEPTAAATANPAETVRRTGRPVRRPRAAAEAGAPAIVPRKGDRFKCVALRHNRPADRQCSFFSGRLCGSLRWGGSDEPLLPSFISFIQSPIVHRQLNMMRRGGSFTFFRGLATCFLSASPDTRDWGTLLINIMCAEYVP